ncbi:serpin-like protein [Leptotrombidium deliense]|uniref:Serpin-like protein n=1 Tax=Leptotrombidium deliense TaxID=299467 RepID=A0A443SHR5_9ACAR|nr:serpin-like protein [Leptotrombidium deliense]
MKSCIAVVSIFVLLCQGFFVQELSTNKPDAAFQEMVNKVKRASFQHTLKMLSLMHSNNERNGIYGSLNFLVSFLSTMNAVGKEGKNETLIKLLNFDKFFTSFDEATNVFANPMFQKLLTAKSVVILSKDFEVKSDYKNRFNNSPFHLYLNVDFQTKDDREKDQQVIRNEVLKLNNTAFADEKEMLNNFTLFFELKEEDIFNMFSYSNYTAKFAPSFRFASAKTLEGAFHSQGSQGYASFMNNKREYNYSTTDDLEGIKIPLESGDALTIILPKKNVPFGKVLEKLGYEAIDEILRKMSPKVIDLRIPKFPNSSISTKNSFFGVNGFDNYFSKNVTWKGISDTNGLYLTQLTMANYIRFEEETSIFERRRPPGGRQMRIIVNAEYPFVYFIHTETGICLYGAYVNYF